jgi:hypothetical protein
MSDAATWDDGVQGAGLGLALVPLVGTFVALRFQAYGWMAVAVAAVPWPFLMRSGGQVDADRKRFRSFKGWQVRGHWLRWGRWRRVQPGDAFTVRHHKQSLMNRRGAPRAAGVEYWDLVCTRNGEQHVWHAFASGRAADAAVVHLTGLL